MGKHRTPYPAEFRARMVELVKAGRTPEELAREFEPSAQTIINWVAQADIDAGVRQDGSDHGRASGARALASREPATEDGARHSLARRGLVRAGDGSRATEGYGFMKANRARWPIATMARLLGVSTSGYYAWLVREPSRQSRSDAQLLARIRTLHASSRGTYGAPRIHAQLAREGVHVGRKRVARLMRIGGPVRGKPTALATYHAATCGGTACAGSGAPALQC